MPTLSRLEEQVLLAVWDLADKAYLLSVKEYLSKVTRKEWSVGLIHKPLLQLERKGFIKSHVGAATARRGGRRKKMYEVTREGIEELQTLRKEQDRLWQNFLGLETVPNDK